MLQSLAYDVGGRPFGSETVIRHMREMTRQLASSDLGHKVWLGRALALLQGLLPVVLFLESAGDGVREEDLASLDALRLMLQRNRLRHGMAFSLVEPAMDRFLEMLPGYDDPGGEAAEHYGHIRLMMGWFLGHPQAATA